METALITGATDGIGKATALKLLTEGWQVVVGGRSAAKCEATIKELKQKSGNDNVTAFIADLSKLSEVKTATEKFLESHNQLDLLLLNANSIANDRIITPEGNEQNFSMGYLSRVLMIKKLEKVLENTPNAHILSVIGMDTVPFDFNDPTIKKNFTGRKGLGRWQWALNLSSNLGTSLSVAKALAATTDWTTFTTTGTIGYNPTLNNSTGFSTLPGGKRYSDGTFYNQGLSGYWWIATEYDTSNSWNRNMYYNNSTVNPNSITKTNGFSVRCIRDSQ